MKSRRVEVGSKAQDDINEIVGFIASVRGSPLTAHRYADEIMDRCARLGDQAFVGTTYDEIREGLRSIPFKGVVIFFHIGAEVVRIDRVVRHERDLQRILREEYGSDT